MEFNIRQAHLSDLPYIYDICLKTGYSGQDSTDLLSDPYIIGQYFAAPYLHYEPDTCFVVIQNGIPKAYIIGSTNTKEYNDWLNIKWLPEIRKFYSKNMSPKSDFEKFLIDIINKDIKSPDFVYEYPSHLHINLLHDLQKQGLGTKLMSIFTDRLKEKGSKGIHFGVAANNTKALAFYNKTGFKELKRDPETVYMGMKFN